MATDPPGQRRRLLLPATLGVAVLAAGGVGTFTALSADSSPVAVVERTTQEPLDGIWIDPVAIPELPTRGPAWERVREYALGDWGDPDIGDQNSDHDAHTLAGALYAARLDDAPMRRRVIDALETVEGSETDEILALSRNLVDYVIAADLIEYRTPEFEAWLDASLERRGSSRAGIRTLKESALRDPTNHGSHARSSVLAVARYLGDDTLVGVVAARFRDWLGRSSDDFEWRELDWQADPDRPRGVNPPGSEIDDQDVDGVLPEEQRRSGDYADPAPREPYVWEGLQGAIVTAELLDRAGYEAWEWEDRALLRAIEWLYADNDYPAEGDDRWIPWLVNARYDTALPVESPTRPGKSVGFTDWTHAN